MELNYWTGDRIRKRHATTTGAGRWSVVLRRADGSKRTMHPRHVVMATGRKRHLRACPIFRRLQNFRGTVLHSSQYDDGEALEGQERAHHRHRQQRPRHRAGSAFERRARSRWCSAARRMIVNVEPSAQLALRALRRRTAAGGLRSDHDVGPAGAGAEEPHRCSPSRQRRSTRSCSTGWSASASGSISARTARAGSSSISPAAAATTSMSAART